jgi:hypothetical protein
MLQKSISSTSAPTSISTAPSSTDTSGSVAVEQPIPVRTLVAICVAAFILVAGLVIFVLWFGARSRRNKLGENLGSTASGHNGNVSGLDYMKGNISGIDGTITGTPDEVHLKGIHGNGTSYTNGGGPSLKGGFASEPSSYYSQQSALRNPAQTTQYDVQHIRHPTEDSFEQQQPVYTIPADYSTTSDPAYADEPSFLPKQNVYTRNDMAPVSPQTATRPLQPPDTTPKSSPRSQSAQPIIRPYAPGAHPYGNSHTRTASIEYQGNYAVATALPEPETVGLGPSSHYYSNSQSSAYAGSSSAINGTFAKAGARPGYDAYGIEPKQPPTPSSHSISQPYSQQAGRQPIQNLNARPSLESIRSIARKASVDRTAAEAASDFVLGGPQAVGASKIRSRNNSIDSSMKGRGVASGSQYGGSPYGGPAYTASIYSSRSGKEGKGGKGDKEKISKSEKKREMEAMDNLIAALDESAMRERRRKEALAEAAGLGSSTSPTHGNGWRGTAGEEESDSSAAPRRRKDLAITGSYPLPPTDVFRAALTSAGRGREPGLDDEVDDEEIERWRRR